MLYDLSMLSPFLVVTIVGLAVLMMDVFAEKGSSKKFLGYFSAAGLGIALLLDLSLFLQGGSALTAPAFAHHISADSFALFANGVILLVGIFVVLSAVDYLPHQRCEWGEFYSLTCFAVLGMMVLASAVDLITLFIGLEIMSIAIYVLAGFKRHSPFAVEAALKYFFLGAFATGFLLYGLAFAYGATGSTNLTEMAAAFAETPPGLYGGIVLAMMIVAFGFKVAAVPFHMWTPDVYEGAPTPVTSLMAAGVKTAGFVAMARLFVVVFDTPGWDDYALHWKTLFFWIAILTMCTGNILALVQRNVKRMLAYSSIAHAGYLLIAVLAVTDTDTGSNVGSGLFIYLLGYAVATTGSFAVIAKFGSHMEEDITYTHLNGFAYKHGGAAVCMVLFMCSLAGFPPLAGFIGKYTVFRQALLADSAYLPLVIVAVLNSVVSAFYYLKVVVHMYMHDEREETRRIQSSPLTAVYAISALLVVLVGSLPDRYLGWSEEAAAATHPVTAIQDVVEIESPVNDPPEAIQQAQTP